MSTAGAGALALALLLLCQATSIATAQAAPFVPTSFTVPTNVTLGPYTLTKVDPRFSEQDYRALMRARHYIRRQLGSEWPEEDFTIAASRQTLADDVLRFDARESFTYHVLQGAHVIGCVYVLPPSNGEVDASLFVWTDPTHLAEAQFDDLREIVHRWLLVDWGLGRIDRSLNAVTSALENT
ncbi:MAG: hypothetical protein AAGA68_09715 [Pseudomonadota bacterium]